MENHGFNNDNDQPQQAGFLSIDQASSNSHTYVYEPDKSLRRITMESLPVANNYSRKISRIHVDQRPTMNELMEGKKLEPIEELEPIQKTALKGKVVKFGWIEGVFMRCLLNIWGVMLFLRLTWVIGQAGLIQGLLIITLCNAVTFITSLSMSAVATNGQIASGGVYYMISRALGPEFGGAIGVMFTVANSISVATYTIGFCDNLFDLLGDVVPGWNGIVDHECFESSCRTNDLRIIGTPVIILILALAIVGMDWVTRVQKLLLVLLILAQIDMLVGSFLKGDTAYEDENGRKAKGFTGWSIETAKENLYSAYDDDVDFMTVFGVFFTAVTGIVAGANLSGDLKDPSSAIPKGTLGAIVLTYITYGAYGVIVGFNFLRRTSGNENEFPFNSTANLTFDDCSDAATALRGEDCKFGSALDQKTMIYLSATGYLVYGGCYGATLSSAIASLVGAPRVLQAVGKDKIYPKIEFFAKGHGANNDPFRGYILVFMIAFGCLMIGDLNTIGKLASNFFLAAYALMNLSVFHSSMTKSPGWRPSFKYYNMWLSLIGAITCVVLMFLMDWPIALATIGIIAILYSLMLYLKPETNWGSSAEALTFVNALNNTQSLNNIQDHIKTYRPKILLLSGNPAHRQPLIDFANLLTKKLSLLICAHVTKEGQITNKTAYKQAVQDWLRDHNIKGFYSLVESEDFTSAAKYSMSLAGVGKLSPNMLLMGLKTKKNDITEIKEYVDVIRQALENDFAVGILSVRGGLDFSSHVASEDTRDEMENKKMRKISVYKGNDGNVLPDNIVRQIQQFQPGKRKGFLDVYWLYDDGGLTILLPHILQTRKQFKDCKMRVFSLSSKAHAVETDTRNFATLLSKFRIEYSEVIMIPDITVKAQDETKKEFENLVAQYPEGAITAADMAANSEPTNRNLRLAEVLRDYSLKSEMIVVSLPIPKRGNSSSALYMAWLEMMSKNMPPILFTRGNQSSVLTYLS